MAKKKKKRAARKPTIPLAVAGGVAHMFTVKGGAGRSMIDDLMTQNWSSIPKDMREIFAGVDADGKFRPEWVLRTYLPVFAGIVIHKAASYLGINRMLGRMGIPLIRI